MARLFNTEADALIEVPVKVLDRGEVTLIDYMGGDKRIVDAARVSYKGGKPIREDEALIRYLVRNRHTSPLEQVVLTFYIYLPIFVMRQIVRHRMARLNELSGRYSEMPDEAYMPDPHELQFQGTINKQAGGMVIPAELASKTIDRLKAEQGIIRAGYESYLKDDVARELARINLPLAQYTACYWQIDAHNLMHFLRLRLDGHAQPQTQAFAKPMAAALQAVAPLAYRAFEDYVLGQCQLQSMTERQSINQLVRDHAPESCIRREAMKLGGKSERAEFLGQFGLAIVEPEAGQA